MNRFGNLGGFSMLQERICSGESLSVPLLAALLRLVIVTLHLDCLQSPFSLKIHLVLISSSMIANHDVIITIRD